MTHKKLIRLYNISASSYYRLLHRHQSRLNKLASFSYYRGRNHRRRRLNPRQVQFIVFRVMGDSPEGYLCVKGHLKPLNE